MLSWINDYGLCRTFEISDKPGLYLQSTRGSRPNIVARPGRNSNASFNFVVVDAPKGGPTQHFRYAIIPTQNRPRGDDLYYFLTMIENEQEQVISLCEGTVPQKDNTVKLWKKPKGHKLTMLGSTYYLEVRIRPRKLCDCGCITQDYPLGVKEVGGTFFNMSVLTGD